MKKIFIISVLFFIILPSAGWSEWKNYYEDSTNIYYYDDETKSAKECKRKSSLVVLNNFF